MRSASVLVALVPLLFACGATPSATSASPRLASTAAPRGAREATTETKVLEADTPVTTPSGATFEAPKGWSLTKRADGLVVVTAPEHDVTLAVVEVEGTDVDAAVSTAWRRLDPSFALPVKNRVVLPARDGWDALAQIDYATKPEESRAVLAIVMRKGTTQYVSLVDGTAAGLSRRGAQLQTALSTVKVEGTGEESFAGKKAHSLDADRLAAFASFIEEARASADVPGVAIAVVQGDEVVLSKGFGVREVGKKAPVTSKTLFLIGSTTKSLTTLLMARLVDAKKLAWTTPMTELLPSFATGDEASTKRLTLGDTVCACAGFPRQDMEMFFHYRGRTAESSLAALRTMKPTTAFGETFQYSNAMVLAGGLAAAHVAEPKLPLAAAYDAALRSEVLKPLGMGATTLAFATATRRDHASPHAMDRSLAVRAMPPSADDFVAYVAPSGGAWSNVEDMARVVRLELRRGELDGKRIVSEENLLARRTPRVKITDKMSYGLGLFVEKQNGVAIGHHGGNTLGFTSDMFFLPDHDVGVVVLTNVAAADTFRAAVRRRFLEIVFDGRAEAREDLAASLERGKKAWKKATENVAPKPDGAWLATLAGTWKNASLGAVTLRADEELGLLDAGDFKVHFTETTTDGTKGLFIVDPPFAGLELRVQESDGKTTLLLDAGQQKYEFTREAPAKR